MKKMFLNKNILKIMLVTFIITGLFLCALPSLVFAAEADPNYIYFDLKAGQVEISTSSYTGYIFETNNGTTTKKTISGTHSEANKYYVYQSASFNQKTTGLVDGTMIIPEYNPIKVDNKLWGEYISNNTDILGIINEWNIQTNGNRESTTNKVLVSAAGKKCNITIDNIWSTYQSASAQLAGGGFNVSGANTKGTHVTLVLRGDNRLGSLRYYSRQTGDNSTLTLTSYKGDKSEEGSLTVIGNQALNRSNSNYTSVSGSSYNVTQNHWDSVIGGTDSNDAVYGLKIKGGTIYSGATARENCTAIGGGGNGMGDVEISGGNITAVTSTTGTAIGGGIAHTSYGGTSDVVISDGKVYAYNFGQPAHDVIKNFGTTNANIIEAASHIAGTAIGGASSILNTGNQTTAYVTISGGYVYAESLGGCGIGAGNSVNTTAGSANVKISGGTVISNSKGQEGYTFSDGKKINIKPGVSIGGGTGGISGNGGSADVTISGGTITAGSIGGGSTTNTNGKIGYANINISGGDISGQFIMVKGATKPCSFNMTNGKIHDSDTSDTEYARLQENGGAVYMDDPDGVATISGGSIEDCKAINGGAVYMTAGTFNLKGTGSIKNCETDNLGGAIYLGQTSTTKGTFNMGNGSISNNKALNGSGGAIYLDGGNANVSGGIIDTNKSINGGGAYLAGGTLNVSGGVFKNNIATDNGGGAFVNSGNIEMSGGSFEGNEAANNGGGVYLAGGALNIRDGEITNNKAYLGGGAYLAGGSLTMEKGNISLNKSSDGAGAYLNGGTLNLTGGSFTQNNATNNGAGAFVNTGNIEMSGGSFDGNIALINGGGAYLAGGTLNVYNGNILNNEAQNGAGAYLNGGTLNLTGGSFTQNNATNNGAGAFVNTGNIEMSGGSFDGNIALINGGGAYLAGGTLNIYNGNILNNKAQNGAGAYLAGGLLNMHNGSFYNNSASQNGGGAFVNSGNIEMSGGSFNGNKADKNGGGVYLTGGTLDITSGSFINNESLQDGGGAYVSGGDFTLNGDTAIFQNNIAINGGGVYLTGGTPNLFKGSLIENIAAKDGGGIYIDTQIVKLSPIGEVNIHSNKAGYISSDEESSFIGRGGGIFIGGTPGLEDAGFSVDLNSTGNVSIINNIAKDFGGGVCINEGFFNVEGTNIKVGKNNASNGGGVAVLAGNFDLSAGTIGGLEEANTAANGGGVYVSGGDVLITGTGAISYNIALDNGGGVCVANGNVKMIGGLIDNNTASNKDGGGIYVSANNKDVSVEILSGSITNNKANLNGGALSVVGNKSGSETITVTIGVNKNHYDSDGNFISCEHGDSETYDCPIIKNNTSNNKGGAVYITGGRLTKLNIYCLEEENNLALGDKDRSNFMMVEGGSVVISTCENNVAGTDSTYGYNEIKGSIRVTAGAMDLYGSMDNPKINAPITVDITSSEDYYRDHRTQSSDEEKYYKLQYFENFENPDGVVTGQYTIYQIKHGDSVEISGVIYSHPGYEIIGWFTQADGGGQRYDVGQYVVFDNAPVGDLTIYAIWQAHSYYVEFDPNVPDGVLFEGTMERVQYTYNTVYKLPANEFIYPGYIFMGWEDQYGNTYEDQQEVSNLSGVDGFSVFLKAIWEECSHDINDSRFEVIYSYSADGNVLTKSCNCLGHEETVTIISQDGVYDGTDHKASLIYSESEWNELLQFVHELNGVQVDNAINAGTYNVSVSFAGKTATATFVVEKANQSAPNKPTFTPVDDGDLKKIVVNHSDLDIVGKEYDYRISYFSNDKIIDLDWQKSNEFSLPVTCTNYIIFIRYAETENYNASPETRADQTYYYSTEVSVIIDCCEGFLCQLQENANSGLDIIVIVLDGYYKSSEFNVTTVTRYSDNQQLSPEQAKVSADLDLLYDIPSGTDKKYEITLTIVGAKKIVNVTSTIAVNKVFDKVTGLEASIARDSAFTAYFEVNDFDSYTNVRLSFNQNLPQYTTVLFINKIDNTYWYYNVDSSSNSIKLSDFKQMGGTSSFMLNGNELKLQFIIDFSLTQEGCPGDYITINLVADPINIDGLIPSFESSERIIDLENVTFEIKDLTPAEKKDLEKDLYFEFAVTSGEASKWDDKVGALVITPIDELPADSRFKLTQNNKTGYYYFNEKGCFIIPLTILDINNIKITLDSSLFPEEGASYKVNIKYYASNSLVGDSPLNGLLIGEISEELVFTAKAKQNYSIKITGEDRVIKIGGELNVSLEYILPEGCTISSDLMRKGEDGEYSSSGARPVIEGPGPLNISLAGLDEGSYCLRIIIKDGDGITLMSVPYYFVIYNSSGSTIS